MGRSSALPCCGLRAGRPHPFSFLSVVAFLSCGGWCFRPHFFSHPSNCGAGGRGGSDGGKSDCGAGERGGGGSDGGKDAEAPLVSIKCASNPTEAEGSHSNDIKNDEIEKIKLQLTAILNFLASFDNHLTIMLNKLALVESCITTNGDPSTAHATTDTPPNKDAVNRKKGLLGSFFSVTDKLPMFCGTLFLWLLSKSSNFEDPWIQAIITISVILFFISFVLLALASNLKEGESTDGVMFNIFKWLLLLLLLTLWPELCMIMRFYAHTPNSLVWSLGILFSIASVSIWVLAFCKVQPEIQKELKDGCVPENNGMVLERSESKAASAPALDVANSYTVQISDAPSICTIPVK